MYTNTHLGFDDVKSEMICLEELKIVKKKAEKVMDEKSISQKIFMAI